MEFSKWSFSKWESVILPHFGATMTLLSRVDRVDRALAMNCEAIVGRERPWPNSQGHIKAVKWWWWNQFSGGGNLVVVFIHQSGDNDYWKQRQKIKTVILIRIKALKHLMLRIVERVYKRGPSSSTWDFPLLVKNKLAVANASLKLRLLLCHHLYDLSNSMTIISYSMYQLFPHYKTAGPAFMQACGGGGHYYYCLLFTGGNYRRPWRPLPSMPFNWPRCP